MKNEWTANVDNRRKYYLMIDTETANGYPDINQSLCYDIGFAVVDKRGKIYEKYSYVCAEVFIDLKEAMKTAFFANKIPKYQADINNGTRKLATLHTIRNKVFQLYDKYNIEYAVAHNARFDCMALNNTVRYVTKSCWRYFLPYGMEWYDTLKMSTDILLKKPSYISFCEKNNFMTNHASPRPQLKAEVIHKFLTGDLDFVESHTGLEDVLIEANIFSYLNRQHKPMRKLLWENSKKESRKITKGGKF